MLTHHFRDKSELIKFVLDTLPEQLVEQMADTAELKGQDPLPKMLMALLPHDAESELRWRVVASFTAASINEPRLREDQARREILIHDWYTQILTNLRDRGVIRPDIEPITEAELMYCFVDGLAMHTLLLPDRYTRKRQKELVAIYVASLAAAGKS